MIDTQAIRSKILDLAMRGQLTEQLPEDGTAEDLYQQIQEEKQKLIKEGKIKKQKPLPKINDEKIPFDIPKSWKWVRLGKLISIESGRGLTASNMNPGDFPVYGGNGIAGYHNCGFVPSKTIVIGRVGYYCGSVHITEKESWVTDNAFVTSYPEKHIDKYYLAYTLQHMKLGQNNNGAAQPVVSGKKIYPLSFPLPPLAEQKRIVKKIEQVFSILDTTDELQAQYADNLTTLKSKLIDAAIQGKLIEQLPEDGTAEELYQQIQEEKQNLIKKGKIKKQKPLPEITDEEIPFDIPDNWKWVRMDEITAKVTSGSTPKGGKKSNAYVSDGFPFFREQNIYDDGIHTDGMVYISEDLLETRLNSTVIAKDILLNITGGSIGRCALIPDDFDRGSINQHILILRMVKPEIRFYIHKLMCSSYVQNYIKNKAVGDKDGFSGGRCKQMLIPFPPLAEQKRIVQKLDEILPLCERIN